MASVHLATGQRITLAVAAAGITGTTAHTVAMLVRMGSYTPDFTEGFGLMDAVGSAPVIFFDTNESGTGAGTLDGFIYTGSFDGESVLTGSYAGWALIGWRHIVNSDNYTFFRILPGETAVTTFTDVNVTAHPPQIDTLVIGDSGFGNNVDIDVRACLADSSVLSDAVLLDLAENFATFDGSTYDVFLALNNSAAAGVNSGTAGNATVTGTPTAGPEPDMGGSGGATVDRSDDNTLSVSDQLLVEKTFPQDSLSVSDQLLTETAFPQDTINLSDSLVKEALYTRNLPGGSSTVFFID